MRQIPEQLEYSVTKLGRVWSREDQKWLVPYETEGRRKYVVLHDNMREHVDCLVLQAFISPQPDGVEPKHLNDNQDD